MISPSSHREVDFDLLDPPRINLPKTARIEAARARQIARQNEAPLSLEAELQATRVLRQRCEALLVELGCPVEVEQDLQRGAA